MKASIVRPQELGHSELTLWRKFQAVDISMQAPFLTPAFALAADAVSSRSRVIVVEDSTSIVGFLPIELRSRTVATAIGRKLNTCQGFVHQPGLEWSWPELLDMSGIEVLELSDLIGSQRQDSRFLNNTVASVVDTSGGWRSYLSRISKRKAIKTILYKERKLRRVEKDVTFRSGETSDCVDLDRLIAWKSRQYRRSGWPDLFARKDVVALLRRLTEDPGAGLYCVGSSLCVDGRTVATDVSLATNTVFAGWVGAHDTDWAQASPGAIRTLRTIEAAFERGVCYIELSRGDEQYKDTLKTGDRTVATGFVARRSPRALAYQACHRPQSAAISFVLSHPEVRSIVRSSLQRVGATRERLAGR